MSIETLKVQIIKKAWEDPAFKAGLLADPKNAIQVAFGINIPPEIELKAVEETSSQFYLVIPPKPEDVADDVVVPNYTWN
jgi:hypothetical protein